MDRNDIRQAFEGPSGITLLHVPTGVHVSVSISSSRDMNQKAAFRLLESRLVNWTKLGKK